MLRLAWHLGSISELHLLVYADDITVWTVHPDLPRQATSLQQALTDTQKWCEYAGLSLSVEKTAILAVANAWGRRRLAMSPISLQLSGQPVRTATSLHVLGLEVSSSGSAALWLRAARQQAGQMLHLIRRISQKSGGSCFKMARILLRSILRSASTCLSGSIPAYDLSGVNPT